MNQLPDPWGPLYRVLSVPAPEDGNRRVNDWAAFRPMAVAARFAQTPLVMGWIRPRPGDPLSFVVGTHTASTRTAASVAPGDRVALAYPPGGDGSLLGPETFPEWASCLRWTRCQGGSDALAVEDDKSNNSSMAPGRSTFETYLGILSGEPFGWLVAAEPLADIEDEIRQLSLRIPLLRNRAQLVETEKLELTRSESRLSELLRVRDAGLWDVHLLVGGRNDDAARQLSSLLVGAVELGDLPYRLVAGSASGSFQGVWRSRSSCADGEAGISSPFRGSAALLAALARPPMQELPGIRMVKQPTFHVTSENQTGIPVGAVLDRSRQESGQFLVPHDTLNRHAFVCGATGSGKSQTVRHLLEQLTHQGVPWLAIEPAKSEYGRMAGRLKGVADVVVIRPGRPGEIPVSLNPLEPEPGFPVQAHVDMVRALFQAAFQATEPFPQVLAMALQRCYEQAGWDLVLNTSSFDHCAPAMPALADLQQAAHEVVSNIGYGEQVMRDVRGFVDVRIGSLRVGAAGRFFEGGHPLDIGALLRSNVVMAIEDIANDQDKAFLMGTFVIRLVEHLRMRTRQNDGPVGLSHVTVIEEAHRLLRNVPAESPSAHAVELFSSLLAEIRAYGEGIVIAEQIPAKVGQEVVRNTALKLMHRLPSKEDRDVVGSTMNLTDEQSQYVVSLEPGVAAAFTDGMDAPVLVRIPHGEGREEELAEPPPPPVQRTRAPTCCATCIKDRPCTLSEIQDAANVIMRSQDGAAALCWIELMTLAHLTGNPPPVLPARLANQFGAWPERTRECLIGQVAESVVARRAPGLRPSYDPDSLAVAMAEAARRRLAVEREEIYSLSDEWVPQPLRWLAAFRAVRDLDWAEPAPPLPFSLGDWAGEADRATVRDRLRVLLRHPWGLHQAENRRLAEVSLEGTDNFAAFHAAAAKVGYGSTPTKRVVNVARMMAYDTTWVADALSTGDEWIRNVGRYEATPAATAPSGGGAAAAAGTGPAATRT